MAEQRTKLAILGWGTGREDVPFDDDSFEIWQLNPRDVAIKGKAGRCDAWFQLHKREWIPEETIDYLKTVSVPVLTFDQIDEIPTNVQFPWWLLLERFPKSLFTSSIAWMLAYALFQGIWKEIHLFGMPLKIGTEYQNQRPAVESFMMFGMAIGLNMVAHPPTELFQPKALYGFEEEPISDTKALLLDRLEHKCALFSQRLSALLLYVDDDHIMEVFLDNPLAAELASGCNPEINRREKKLAVVAALKARKRERMKRYEFARA